MPDEVSYDSNAETVPAASDATRPDQARLPLRAAALCIALTLDRPAQV